MIKNTVAVLLLYTSLMCIGCRRNAGVSAMVPNKQSAPAATAKGQDRLLQRASDLFDAVRVNGNVVVAVGNNGEIIRSHDGGRLWSKVSSGTSEPLFSVAFSSDKHGVIVGFKGTYLESFDGGRTWTPRSIGTHRNLFVIRFFNHRHGFVLGAFGTLMESGDSGKTWQPVNLNWDKLLPGLTQQVGTVQPHLYGIDFCDAQHGWIVGEYGLVLETEDGGKTWHRQNGGGMADRQLFTVATTGPGKVVTSGQGGEILYSSDYGRHWVTVLPPDGRDIYGLVPFGSRTELLAIGDLGNAFISTAGGCLGSWHRVDLTGRGAAGPLMDTWLATAVPEPGAVLAVGQLGIWRLHLAPTTKSHS